MMVRIVWTDSGTFHEKGWESKTEILESSHGLSDVVTVGELVHEEEDKYFVALSSDHVNSHYYGIQIIGKFAVKEFNELVTAPSLEVYFGKKSEQLPSADYFARLGDEYEY